MSTLDITPVVKDSIETKQATVSLVALRQAFSATKWEVYQPTSSTVMGQHANEAYLQ